MQVSRLSALFLTSFLIGCASPNVSKEIQEAPEHAAMQVEEKTDQKNLLSDLWWTWKYVMWGQGSREEWPWAW